MNLDKNEMIKLVISSVFIAGYFIVTYMFLIGKVSVKEELIPTLQIIIGVLTGGVVQVLNYWIGSSNGSAVKTNMMKK